VHTVGIDRVIPFVNASAEARPDSPAVQASDAARAWRPSFLLELSADAGAAEVLLDAATGA
jgi:hypothetical protein